MLRSCGNECKKYNEEEEINDNLQKCAVGALRAISAITRFTVDRRCLVVKIKIFDFFENDPFESFALRVTPAVTRLTFYCWH